jgi:hypothetical protein
MKFVRVPNNQGVVEGIMGFAISSVYHSGYQEQEQLGAGKDDESSGDYLPFSLGRINKRLR